MWISCGAHGRTVAIHSLSHSKLQFAIVINTRMLDSYISSMRPFLHNLPYRHALPISSLSILIFHLSAVLGTITPETQEMFEKKITTGRHSRHVLTASIRKWVKLTPPGSRRSPPGAIILFECATILNPDAKPSWPRYEPDAIVPSRLESRLRRSVPPIQSLPVYRNLRRVNRENRE